MPFFRYAWKIGTFETTVKLIKEGPGHINHFSIMIKRSLCHGYLTENGRTKSTIAAKAGCTANFFKKSNKKALFQAHSIYKGE